MNSITVAVQSPSCVRLFATQQTAALQAFMTLIISRSLSKFISILLVMPSSHLILWCPLLLLPSIFPNSRDFSNESSVCIRWQKYWSLSFSISLSIEFSSVQFVLYCAKSLHSCPTLCDPMDCSPPGSSVHGILQAKIPEWVAMPSSRDLLDPGTEPASLTTFALAGRFFTAGAT